MDQLSPELARVTLRMEFADGTVREFDAPRPAHSELTIHQPWPGVSEVRTTDPFLIDRGYPRSVDLSFEASHDARYPLAVRSYTEMDMQGNGRRLALVTEVVDNFLAAYGHSQILMFKIGQDLATSIRKILDGNLAEPAAVLGGKDEEG